MASDSIEPHASEEQAFIHQLLDVAKIARCTSGDKVPA